MHSVDQTLRVTRKKVPVKSMHYIGVITQFINISTGSCYASKNNYWIWNIKYSWKIKSLHVLQLLKIR